MEAQNEVDRIALAAIRVDPRGPSLWMLGNGWGGDDCQMAPPEVYFTHGGLTALFPAEGSKRSPGWPNFFGTHPKHR